MSENGSALVEAQELLGGNDRVTLTERAGLGLINFRGDESLTSAIKKNIGIALPTTANTYSQNDDWLGCWAGPDEWILISEKAVNTAPIISDIEKALTKSHFAITDQSSGYSVIHLTGSRVRDVLQRGMTFDVHQRNFTEGQCTQTALEKMPVMLIARKNDEVSSEMDLIVRRSYADYCLRWLNDARTEYRS